MPKKNIYLKSLAALLLSTILLFIVTYFSNKYLDTEKKYLLIVVITISELLYLLTYKLSFKKQDPDYNLYGELPFYLCNITSFSCLLASILKIQAMQAYCVYIGTFCVLLAYCMPDISDADNMLSGIYGSGFYVYHSLLSVSCLSFYTLGLLNTDKSYIGYVLLHLTICTIIAHFVNYILRKTKLNNAANYMYTYNPDNFILESFYKIIPVKFFYLVPISIPIGLYCYGIYLLIR